MFPFARCLSISLSHWNGNSNNNKKGGEKKRKRLTCAFCLHALHPKHQLPSPLSSHIVSDKKIAGDTERYFELYGGVRACAFNSTFFVTY